MMNLIQKIFKDFYIRKCNYVTGSGFTDANYFELDLECSTYFDYHSVLSKLEDSGVLYKYYTNIVLRMAHPMDIGTIYDYPTVEISARLKYDETLLKSALVINKFNL